MGLVDTDIVAEEYRLQFGLVMAGGSITLVKVGGSALLVEGLASVVFHLLEEPHRQTQPPERTTLVIGVPARWYAS